MERQIASSAGILLVTDADGTLADRIRILAEQGLEAPEIAKKLSCKRTYAAWVIWRDKNKTSRRKWEAKYRKDKYNTSPEVRTRVLSTLQNRRSRARADRKSRP